MLARALGLYLLGFVLLSGSGWARVQWLVLVAVALLFAAAWMLQRALGDVPPASRRRIPLLILGAGAVAFLVWLAGGRLVAIPGGVGLGGVCAMYLGFGHWLTEFRSEDTQALRHGGWISGGCAVAFAAGLAVCFSLTTAGLVLAAIGLLAAPVGLTLLSDGILREPRRWLRFAAGAAPVLVLAGAVWVGHALHLQLWLAIAFAVPVVGGLIFAIASSTQADVLLLVTVIGIFWASQPSGTATDDLPAPTDGRAALVALGDSYISGEGAREFLEGTNDAGGDQCRRAPQAYARRIFLDQRAGRLERLAFLACSGAETSELRGKQVARLKELIGEGLKPQLVVVSIGGNDAGFANIAMDCVAPGTCAERGQLWLDGLPSVADRVYDTYVDIRNAVGLDVPVVAVPYPVPVREGRCSYSPLGAAENRFLQRFVVQLDRAVEAAAQHAGVAYLAGMRDVLTQAHLRICDSTDEDAIGVNLIRLKSVNGVVDQLLDPRIWIHNSFHPNEKGHERMAGVLEDWIAANPAPQAGPGPQGRPAFRPESLATVMGPEVGHYCGDGSGAEPHYCGRGDLSWALTKVAAAFGVLTPALLFLVAGWWLLALLVLQRLHHETPPGD